MAITCPHCSRKCIANMDSKTNLRLLMILGCHMIVTALNEITVEVILLVIVKVVVVKVIVVVYI